ncbi:MAG: hypothetical protein AB1Z98_38910 [Nannocystaceae bacterium]
MYDTDPELVAAVLDDYDSAPIDETLRAALRLLHTLTVQPQGLDVEDMDRARAAGLSDRAIVEAMHVGFVFNVIDRLADAFDFDLENPRDQARATGLMRRFGYGLSAIPP